MDHLIRYDWPGNVRELMNAVERAVVLSRADWLSEKDFPIIVGSEQNITTAENMQPISADGATPLEEVEKATILRTMEATGGNKSEAARRLGITLLVEHSW
jgi:two-component system response regulator HydG